MNFKLPLFLSFLFISNFLFAQNPDEQNFTKYIEVNGDAEELVIPDEIYISITIKERESGRDKISIQQQEDDLKKALINIDIPLENLAVSNAQADYIRVKWSKKDVVSQSNYELKVKSAKQVADVFEVMDKLKIENSTISKVSHSDIENLKKQVRIKAIKNAKEKSDYLLEAIGQKTGSALIVREDQREYDGVPVFRTDDINMRGARSDATLYIINGSKFEVKFKKIKLESHIYVKFEIE